MSVLTRTSCALVLLAAVACAPAAPAPEAAAPAAGAFPVTVTHAFGETVVPAEPVRVVTAGLTEQDVVLALGVTPVGVTEWYGDQPYATWPWAQDELGGATPEVLSVADTFEYEKIAGLAPDLIVAVNAGLDQASYDRLSAIAPTVAQPTDGPSNFAPWDAQTLIVGQALGRADEAQALITGIKDRFAAEAAAHPQFAGVPAVFLQAPYYDGSAIAYQDGLSTEFLTDLGFVVPSEIDRFAPEGDTAQAYIPLENLGVLDSADVLLWATEDTTARAELEAQPLYRQLAAVRGGNLVFTYGELAGAIYFATPLSLPYVLDRLVPLLDRAVAGDPETVPAP
ncbi:iron-siderophore ABC transporter substrate-binding protein [Pseudonocardia broussonetiae]|uniref:Iron-siderophore ABC transporter substrate-binding protein n=1 Tax=Pseudonocardia broussonetiae TaxID=2736640 RepID=A0A6M6JGZ6_9PSEU|nr:iron-siderophore ABC transporter substrate-binding protein [Pseudonocardia broussonetiae]QJY47294.1 iron-siderophore ABC transporter substrate-binding protein [Pseudonocardia broussonetiae]